MKKIITEYYCDVCGNKTENKESETPVIFTTEQNEGKSCHPYLSKEDLVLCDNCKKKMLTKGMFIFAEGAMGSNKYFFKGSDD